MNLNSFIEQCGFLLYASREKGLGTTSGFQIIAMKNTKTDRSTLSLGEPRLWATNFVSSMLFDTRNEIRDKEFSDDKILESLSAQN